MVAISGKTSCEMTSSGTPNRLATARPTSPTIGGSVMQRTMSGRRPPIPAASALPTKVT